MALIGMLLSMSLIAAACGSDDDNTAGGTDTTGAKTTDMAKVKEGGTIAYAAEQEPTGFNNLTSKDNLAELRHIMRHVWPFAYLTKPDLSVEPTAVLAGEAEVTSESPFTVEWKINPKAVWSDGVPVSPDDFEWNYLSCNNKVDPGEPTTKNDKTGADESGLDCASTAGLDKVTKFEKVDDRTFRMTFDEPYVEYKGLFGDPMPPAHIGKTLPDGWNTGFDKDPLVSAGPYKLKEYVKGQSITLERNDKWWGPKPHLDTIVFREIPDPATHPDALRNNEVQLIYPQPQTDLVDLVKEIPGVKYELNFGPTWEHLDFNFKNELLAMKEVRQAVAWGIDRDRYVDTLMKPFSDKAKRLDNHVFMSNQPEYEAHGQEYAKRDVAKATGGLEKAGFAKGPDGIYAKDGKRLSFRLRVKSPNPLREQMEELMQADLKEVGIEIKIANFGDPDTIGGIGSKGDFDLFIFAWVGTPYEVSGAQQEYESTSDSNFGKFSSPEVDAAIKKAATILDEGDRADQLNKVDELIWEGLASIPLFQKPVGLLAYSDKYANISDNTSTEGPFWNSLNWGFKAAAE
ncbi:MAG TPA: ABC transporter family substrate-binding protein [Acidimicrobiales bacterium]|nr:ABC transporter family substrate-binding protein [Acidimicrobiales bacterium]